MAWYWKIQQNLLAHSNHEKMNTFTKILIRSGLLKLSINRVEKWAVNGRVDEIEYSLEHGMFNVREKAAQELGKLKSKASVPLLVHAIDDKIKNVSLAAMKAIEEIQPTTDFQEKIKSKRKYWTERETQEKQLKRKPSSQTNRKWERRSKQTLDNLKQMLKKPMIGGKWF